jgi:hypothetical protein
MFAKVGTQTDTTANLRRRQAQFPIVKTVRRLLSSSGHVSSTSESGAVFVAIYLRHRSRPPRKNSANSIFDISNIEMHLRQLA